MLATVRENNALKKGGPEHENFLEEQRVNISIKKALQNMKLNYCKNERTMHVPTFFLTLSCADLR